MKLFEEYFYHDETFFITYMQLVCYICVTY